MINKKLIQIEENHLKSCTDYLMGLEQRMEHKIQESFDTLYNKLRHIKGGHRDASPIDNAQNNTMKKESSGNLTNYFKQLFNGGIAKRLNPKKSQNKKQADTRLDYLASSKSKSDD